MIASVSTAIERELAALLGAEGSLPGTTRAYLTDATESRNLRGRADAVALPASAEEVADVVRWCYQHDVPLIPRGGGTGFTGGAVPLDGGVVLSLERLRAVKQLDPGFWRVAVDAGVTTADLRRRARENGLLFPPDPGAAEQSQIGGNIATNAGGPHAFKYGVTGAWVTGLDVVLAPGESVTFGGPVRKDVAGYDIKSLMIGSEGTLGVVTAAWLRLIPAPEVALPVVALYPSISAGCAALESALGSGVVPAALEYLDEGALNASKGAFPVAIPGGIPVGLRGGIPVGIPGGIPETAGFMLIADVDGTVDEAARLRFELIGALEGGAVAIHAPDDARAIAELWRWRDGTSLAVTTQRGGKVSEDIAVPVDRLREAIEGTIEIGRRYGLEACSWGHAGDGNLHSTFMIDLDDSSELTRAELAAEELFALAGRLGGSVSGEHGLGSVKRGALAQQWAPAALTRHETIKRVFDPKGLMNPGKKLARAQRPLSAGSDQPAGRAVTA